MRAVVQRVARARVFGDGQLLGEVNGGLCVLLGVARSDGERDAQALARKVARLRIFPDDEGRFSHSVRDVGGSALVVSQFTLIADTSRGNRPSFSRGGAEPTRPSPSTSSSAPRCAPRGCPFRPVASAP